MPFRLEADPTFRDVLGAADRAQIGMWVCSGHALVAEICAGSGMDWILIDAEHSPNSLEGIQAQLQVLAGYPVTALVRVPQGEPVIMKQALDLGAQNLLVPMVNNAEHAKAMVEAIRYPLRGIRGVGSALARASRWNRIENYLERAHELVSLCVQIETSEAVANVEEILAVDGVDAIFVGPSDLSASMGLLGQQEHPDVVAAVTHCIEAAKAAAKPVGVNAFAKPRAEFYIEHGVDFILVGADVSVLARASEALAASFIPDIDDVKRASY